jgi:hypothetical protein
MRSLTSKFFVGAFAGALACLASTPVARAQLLDTLPGWDGFNFISPFGPAGVGTPTYGETFTAPGGNLALDDFSFFVASLDGNFLPTATDTYNVQAEVFQWTGDLIAGNGPQGVTGSPLYVSPTFAISPDGVGYLDSGFDQVEVDLPAPLALTAGDNYILLLNDVDSVGQVDGDTMAFALDGSFSHYTPGDAGGGFNYSNYGPGGFLGDGSWSNGPGAYVDDGNDFGDLIFTADFSPVQQTGGGGSSVPDAGATVLLLGLGLAGLALHSRRRLALV